MFILRFLARAILGVILLGLLFTFSPLSFPSIRIESVQKVQRTPLAEGALPIEMISGTSLSTATVATATTTQTDAQKAPAPPAPLDHTKVEAAWRDWMARNNVAKSAMALGAGGTVIHTAGIGREAGTAYPAASLSKAVTAMCLTSLLEQSPHSWSSPLSAFTQVWAKLDVHPHADLAKLPLSALVTHTSGLPKNIDADGTAGEGRNLYTQIHFARSALRNPTHLTSSRKYVYSNVNFALLGQIIEGLSGQSYGDTCFETTLAPAGATAATLGGRMWATAGFGGWSVSASDYAQFVMHWHGPDRPWVADPAAYAYDRKSGAGLGVFHRYEDDRHTMNHSGLWRSKTPAHRIGAMFVTSATGAVFVANWQGSLKSAAYTDLRKSITAALH